LSGVEVAKGGRECHWWERTDCTWRIQLQFNL